MKTAHRSPLRCSDTLHYKDTCVYMFSSNGNSNNRQHKTGSLIANSLGSYESLPNAKRLPCNGAFFNN